MIAPPPPASIKGTAARVSRVRGEHIEAERLGHVLRRRVQQGVGDGATEIVDHDVEPPEGFVGLRSETGDHGQSAQVSGHHLRPASPVGDLLGHLLELRLGTGRDDNIGPRFGQGDRGGGADTAARPGDHGGLAIAPKPVGNHFHLLRAAPPLPHR